MYDVNDAEKCSLKSKKMNIRQIILQFDMMMGHGKSHINRGQTMRTTASQIVVLCEMMRDRHNCPLDDLVEVVIIEKIIALVCVVVGVLIALLVALSSSRQMFRDSCLKQPLLTCFTLQAGVVLNNGFLTVDISESS